MPFFPFLLVQVVLIFRLAALVGLPIPGILARGMNCWIVGGSAGELLRGPISTFPLVTVLGVDASRGVLEGRNRYIPPNPAPKRKLDPSRSAVFAVLSSASTINPAAPTTAAAVDAVSLSGAAGWAGVTNVTIFLIIDKNECPVGSHRPIGLPSQYE